MVRKRIKTKMEIKDVFVRDKDDFIGLAKELGIKRSILSLLIDKDELPKIIKDKKGTYLVVNTIIRIKDYLEDYSFGIILSKNRIVVLRRFKSPLFKSLVGDNLEEVIYNLLKKNLILIERELKAIKKGYLELEKEIELGKEEDISFDLWSLRDDIKTIKRSLKENEIIYANISKILKVKGENTFKFKDLYFSLRQLFALAESLEYEVKTAFDAYLSFTSHSLSKKIEKLTYITIALSIPSIIAGFYGMNVKIPFQSFEFYFLTIILISSLIASLVYFLLNK